MIQSRFSWYVTCNACEAECDRDYYDDDDYATPEAAAHAADLAGWFIAEGVHLCGFDDLRHLTYVRTFLWDLLEAKDQQELLEWYPKTWDDEE